MTYGHLCYYVNGMLSVPAATEGFTNFFDVDADTMKYDEEAMQNDIETIGLFDYEEDFSSLIPESIFDAFNGKYLKISMAKGLLTQEELLARIEHYSIFFDGGEDK